MTLEVLFAQALQGRTFLLMVLCGAAMGLLAHLSSWLHGVKRWLGMTADLLCALALTLALGWILLHSGEGLRLYGLLGLCIGGALYAAGIAPILGFLRGIIARGQKRRAQPPIRRP